MWLNIPTAAHTTTLPPPALLLPSFVFWKLLTIHSCPVTFNQQGDRFPATGCDVTGPPVSLQFYPFVQKQNTSVTSGWEAVGCSDLLIIGTRMCRNTLASSTSQPFFKHVNLPAQVGCSSDPPSHRLTDDSRAQTGSRHLYCVHNDRTWRMSLDGFQS